MALGAKASLSPYDSAWVKAQYAIAHNERIKITLPWRRKQRVRGWGGERVKGWYQLLTYFCGDALDQSGGNKPESKILPLSPSPPLPLLPLPLYFQIRHYELRTQQRMKIDFSRYLYGKGTKRKDEECCIYFTSLILLTKQPMNWGLV